MIFDFWYGDTIKDITSIDCFYSDIDYVYRGNMYINGRIVGDYCTRNSQDIEKYFGNIYSF